MQKIESLRSSINLRRTNPVLQQSDVQEYLDQLHKQFVVVQIDKAVISPQSFGEELDFHRHLHGGGNHF